MTVFLDILVVVLVLAAIFFVCIMLPLALYAHFRSDMALEKLFEKWDLKIDALWFETFFVVYIIVSLILFAVYMFVAH